MTPWVVVDFCRQVILFAAFVYVAWFKTKLTWKMSLSCKLHEKKNFIPI